MAYQIEGLEPLPYAPLFRMTDDELATHSARRVVATAKPGFPCRVTLEDAEPGETVILFNHVSNDVAGPFRASFAIYVREGADRAVFRDALPPVFQGRTISLRGLDRGGNLKAAMLATTDDADSKIRTMFDDAGIAVIHAHNAAAGCFAATIVRD